MAKGRIATLWFLGLLASLPVVRADVRDVHVTDKRWRLELVAQQPEIVTPIGVVCDPRGRLLIVESHTHKRPKDYIGPPADRIRMLTDSDGDGRLDCWSTFHEGLHYSVNRAIQAGDVYVVTGQAIVRL